MATNSQWGWPLLFRLTLRQNANDEVFDSKHSLPSLYNPKSAASEAYRMLRTNIRFSAGGDSLKVIEITSAFPGEGKTLTATNLAITFAQAGTSVVLVDADMRRSRVHKYFELPLTPGLSEAVVTGDLNASIKPGPVEHLSIITAGTSPPNPAELLHSASMDSLLEQLRAMYELVVIDAPPVLAVADASVIAHKADGVLGVISIGMTNRNANQRALAALKSVNARLLGLVVTGVRPGRRGYGSHGRYGGYDNYYYYYDSSYGSDDSDDAEGESAN